VAFTRASVLLVSGMARAIAAAFSTLLRAYSMLVLDGVRTSTASVP
jgi:hypothetical protein